MLFRSVGFDVFLGAVGFDVFLGVVGFDVFLGVVGFDVFLGAVGFDVFLGAVGFDVFLGVVGSDNLLLYPSFFNRCVPVRLDAPKIVFALRILGEWVAPVVDFSGDLTSFFDICDDNFIAAARFLPFLISTGHSIPFLSSIFSKGPRK